jgi:hypothetical protein
MMKKDLYIRSKHADTFYTSIIECDQAPILWIIDRPTKVFAHHTDLPAILGDREHCPDILQQQFTSCTVLAYAFIQTVDVPFDHTKLVGTVMSISAKIVPWCHQCLGCPVGCFLRSPLRSSEQPTPAQRVKQPSHLGHFRSQTRI